MPVLLAGGLTGFIDMESERGPDLEGGAWKEGGAEARPEREGGGMLVPGREGGW